MSFKWMAYDITTVKGFHFEPKGEFFLPVNPEVTKDSEWKLKNIFRSCFWKYLNP